MTVEEASEPGDGAGGPPWLPSIANWFLAATILLALPRMWVPAAMTLSVGLALSALAARRKRRAVASTDGSARGPSGDAGVRAEGDSS